MLILDAINPIERVKLTGQLSAAIKTLSGDVSALQRVRLAKQIADILARLGVGLAEEDDDLSDDPNAENYRYKDTGYIPDSRKENAVSFIKRAAFNGDAVVFTDIDWNAIEQNPRQAAELITKSNLFGKTDWAALQAIGMDAGAGFLIDRIYASIGTEPSTEGAFGRKDYALALQTIRQRLEKCKTAQEVTDVLGEIREELNGVQLNADESARYEVLQAEYNAASSEYYRLEKEREEIGKNIKWGKVQSLGWDQEKRTRRGWKPDPAIDEEIAKIKAENEKWTEVLNKWEADHPEFKSTYESSVISTDGGIERVSASLRGGLRDRMTAATRAKRALQDEAHKRNVIESPLTRGWISFGEKFFAVLNYRSSRGSTAFAGHVTNARSGRIPDWSWAEKERTTVKRATKEEVRFQMKVAENFNRRGGKAISVKSTAELKDMMGFRDIQSGNWVLKDPNSAKFHVEQTAAAMSDLGDMLGIPVNALGLGGRLAMAFGARGQGAKGWKGAAASAHYERTHRIINLTKMGGGGSLGHEFSHALDDMIGELATGKVAEKPEMASTNPMVLPEGAMRDAMLAVRREMLNGDTRLQEVYTITDKDRSAAKYNLDRGIVGNVAQKIKSAGNIEGAVIAVKDYIGDVAGNKKRKKNLDAWLKIAVAYYLEEGKDRAVIRTGSLGSNFYAGAVELDGGEQNKYWSTTEEMFARAFQAYIEDKLRDNDRQNDYLSVYADNKYHVDPMLGIEWKPFPEGEERARINSAFDQFFGAIRDEKVFENAVKNKKLLDAIFGGV